MVANPTNHLLDLVLMPKKTFKLGRQRKYEYWKKKTKHPACKLVVEHPSLSQNSILVQPTSPSLEKTDCEDSLVLSLPLDTFTDGYAFTISYLRKRIQELFVLPLGQIDALYNVTCVPGLGLVTITIVINCNRLHVFV